MSDEVKVGGAYSKNHDVCVKFKDVDQSTYIVPLSTLKLVCESDQYGAGFHPDQYISISVETYEELERIMMDGWEI